MTLGRQLAAESLGTALLLATVIGSGIMGERLAGNNVAIALLANSIATGAVLYALILVFAPISGAHFNPAVTLVTALNRQLGLTAAMVYVCAQIAGAFAGVAAAHAMFGEPLFFASQHQRTGAAQWWAEGVATFGLLVVVLGSARQSVPAVAAAVGAYITAAYWFTASTSFANPAVTLARAASDTFAGIRPVDAPAFILAQMAGALAAAAVMRWFGAAGNASEEGR
jgi:glycerol uptake facilitator-like aquaporin